MTHQKIVVCSYHNTRVNDDEELITLTAMCIRRSQFGFFWRAGGGGRMRGAARGHFCTMCPPQCAPHISYCSCKIFSPYNCQIFCNGCPQICLMWKIFFWKVQLCLLLFTSTRHPSKTGGRGQNSPYVKLFSSRYFFVKEVSSFFIVCLFLSLVLTYVCVNVGNLRPVNAVKKKTLAHWSHLGWTWFGSKPQEKLVDCAESEPYENLVYPWFAWTE